MLYLYTGVPGAGKTLYAVSNLVKRKDFKDRPIFVDGIKDLDHDKINYFDIPEGESIQTWPKWAPPGAIIVVDECQRIFRPRPSGSKVPDYVAELETHRHRGLDFILITQNPRLIDVHLRGLIEHHTHLGKTNLGLRRKMEWTTGGAKDPESRANIREALISVYRLDKSVYGLYKSAEVHTKIRTKKSKLLMLFPLALCLVGYGIWSFTDFWGKFSGEGEKAKKASTTQTAQAQTQPSAVSASEPVTNGQYPKAETKPEEPKKPHLSEEDYQPRIAERPETAPIYDGMNKAVKVMPWPAACIKAENRCTCYTDQGTKIKDIGKQTCLNYVKDGLPFNPYKAQTAENAKPTQTAYTPDAPQVLTMGGHTPQNLMYDGYNDKALTNTGGKVN
ncbi:zonular occludens toxin family protein [Morococcus cerebrosus]|uniref:zonular occludens toxin family protein n=1 Tax=Morococcus cerebrosus TaxID=1056807 RepID=UPI000669B176|nr:zonular occludens toxin domain-containing protein [Morococcus cerebrosus]